MEGAVGPRRWHCSDLGLIPVGYDRRAAAGRFNFAFEAEELGGFTVVIRPATVEALALVSALPSYAPVTRITADLLVGLRPLCREFAGLIVAWNLETNDEPVPVTPEAFLALDALFVLRVVMTWARVMVGLPQTLTVDEPVEDEAFDESEIRMEELAS